MYFGLAEDLPTEDDQVRHRAHAYRSSQASSLSGGSGSDGEKADGRHGARLRECKCSTDFGEGSSHTRREGYLARTKIAAMPRLIEGHRFLREMTARFRAEDLRKPNCMRLEWECFMHFQRSVSFRFPGGTPWERWPRKCENAL